MPYIAGPHDDTRGEPSRTMCRALLLTAILEELPGVVDDLREECEELASRLEQTAGPKDYAPYLFTVGMLRAAASREAMAEAAIRAVGPAQVRARLLDRARTSVALWSELRLWGQAFRLSDSQGTRNAWLLQHALDVLRGRPWGMLGTGVGPATVPGTSDDWTIMLKSEGGKGLPAPPWSLAARPT